MNIVKILLYVFIFYSQAESWGPQAHRIINREAIKLLPAPLNSFFIAYQDSIIGLADAPDEWAKENPGLKNHHYIDLDLLAQYPFSCIPRNIMDAQKRFSTEKIAEAGCLPWSIETHYKDLIENYKKRTWESVRNDVICLAHFIADGHQPLHLTVNHNGGMTGNAGVHFRYEIDLLRYYPDNYNNLTISPLPIKAIPIDSINTHTFEFMIQTYPYVDSIHCADISCKENRQNYDSAYFDCFEKKVGKRLRKQLELSAKAVSTYWFSAWVDAGNPEMVLSASKSIADNKDSFSDAFTGDTDKNIAKSRSNEEITDTESVSGMHGTYKVSIGPTDKHHVFTVVIDPGHGGEDPGAVGPEGSKEKDITLTVALKLKDLLKNNSGMKIILTRDKDVFVKLSERTKIANRNGADLFVSIHCNSISGPKSRQDTTCGYKIFINSLAKVEDDRLVAMKENSAIQFEKTNKDGDASNSLEKILLSMLHNEFLKESQDFAGCIVNKMGRMVSETSKQHTGLGQAGFYVLNGAHMPSVLAEIGYISHSRECSRLKSPAFQDKIAKALYQAILSFKRQYETP